MTTNTGSLDFTPEDFQRFADLLLLKCGLQFDNSKFMVLRGAIRDRLKHNGLTDLTAYYRLVDTANANFQIGWEGNEPGEHTSTQNPADRELRRLVELLTVNETQFFRNKEHFKALQEDVFPRLIKRHEQDRHLRIWSAGCSTGQEPYSLAMCAVMALEKAGYSVTGSSPWKISVLASDISERALRIAHAARYRREDLKGLEEKVIHRFFHSNSSAHMQTAPLEPGQILGPNRAPLARGYDRVSYQVVPEIKKMVRFTNFNLANAVYPVDPYGNFDLVLCENVTIYFSPDTTQRVIQNIFRSLVDGGFLFIGYSETLWQVSSSFRLVNSHDTFYYQKPYPNDPAVPRYVRTRPTTGPLTPEQLAEFSSNLSSTPEELKKPSVKIAHREVHKPVPVTPAPPPPVKRETDKIARSAPPVPPKPEPAPVPVVTGDDWQAILKAGLNCMAEHDFETAAIYLGEALKLRKNQPEVLVAVAQLKTKLGAYNEAADYSRKAIAIDPLSEEAHLILAMIHHREGRIEESIAEFQKTIYINIDSVVAHLRLADIYRRQGQTGPALREYRSTLSALEKHRPDEIIEEIPVELLKRTCEQNIRQLTR